MNKPVDIDRPIALEMQSDTICPNCGSTMSEENIIKGSRFNRRVDRLVCGCGYSTLKRTKREILRDLGEVE